MRYTKARGALVSLAIILALMTALPARNALAQDAPTPGGTLTIAFVPLTTDIDVNARNVSTLNEQAQYFYETLFDRDANGDVQPLLAEDFEVSDDGLVHTWTLQPDVTFHEGSTFDAEAVKWNLERKIELEQPLWDLIPFDSIEVIDPLTVQVTLTRPSPGMYGVLAAKTWSMYSPTFAQEVGDEGLKSQASGTGPFMVETFVPNEDLVLTKNPNYWQEGLPYLDSVVFRAVPDISTRAIQLEAGDVDMALDLAIQDVERLRTNSDLRVEEGVGSRQYYITMNNAKAPLDDVRVRQALNHAVDKEGIIQAVFLGRYATLAEAVYLNPAVEGFVAAGSYAYDPEQAAALLEEAGWVDADGNGIREKDGQPLNLTLHTRRGGTAGDIEIAELVQGMLQQVGVGVEIIVLDSAAFIAEVTKPVEEATYDLVSLTVGTFTGDAEYIMETFYACDSAAPRYYNRAYFCDEEVDQLIEESSAIPTLEGRNEIYAEVVQRVYEQAPIIMLFDVLETAAMRNNVQGVYFEPAGVNWPAKYAWIQQEG
jgi:peptide/nickel transport system substrate-binding protein